MWAPHRASVGVLSAEMMDRFVHSCCPSRKWNTVPSRETLAPDYALVKALDLFPRSGAYVECVEIEGKSAAGVPTGNWRCSQGDRCSGSSSATSRRANFRLYEDAPRPIGSWRRAPCARKSPRSQRPLSRGGLPLRRGRGHCPAAPPASARRGAAANWAPRLSTATFVTVSQGCATVGSTINSQGDKWSLQKNYPRWQQRCASSEV